MVACDMWIALHVRVTSVLAVVQQHIRKEDEFKSSGDWNIVGGEVTDSISGLCLTGSIFKVSK